MLQLQYIRDHHEEAIQRLRVRGWDATDLVNQVVEADQQRRKTQAEADNAQAEANRLAKEIGQRFKEGKREEAEGLKQRTSELKTQLKELNDRRDELQQTLTDLLYQLPNVPNPLVPEGKTDEDNELIHQEGDIPALPEDAQPHWELAKEYNLIDFELGVKISGAGFPVYRHQGARLQRAMMAYFLDQAAAAGYEEVMPPLLVNEATGYGTGQLPDKEGQMYHMPEDNLYLIPTAEVPITNLYRDVIVQESDFPIQLCGYTPCFRREAGSYGKDVRGLNRLHQFDKVEIVQIVHPEKSYQVLEGMVEHVKDLLRQLELPFRVVRLCGGDLGFTSALTYDLEVYSAAQNRWLEVSSVSNFETFQANRLKCRYRDSAGKTQLVHTLNGSALAFPRILAALLENNQGPDGIRIPGALVPYTGFDRIHRP